MKRLILLFSILLVSAVVAAPKDLKADDSYLTYDQLRAYQEWKAEQEWSNQLVAHATSLVGRRTGQCVTFLRTHYGVPRNEIQGAAIYIKPTPGFKGKIGHVILFRYNHVGMVIGEDAQYWYYSHSNVENYRAPSQRGTNRIDKIFKNSPLIRGYKIINYQNHG